LIQIRSPLFADLREHAKKLRTEATLERHAYMSLYSRHPSDSVLGLEDSEVDKYLSFCESVFATESTGENALVLVACYY
jgi:hypothetical protein